MTEEYTACISQACEWGKDTLIPGDVDRPVVVSYVFLLRFTVEVLHALEIGLCLGYTEHDILTGIAGELWTKVNESGKQCQSQDG